MLGRKGGGGGGGGGREGTCCSSKKNPSISISKDCNNVLVQRQALR